MKNKFLPLTLAMIGCLALPASADMLIPNGDFSLGGTGWVANSGLGEQPATTFATGGNPGGYGTVTPNAGWGILVSPTAAGATGAGYDLASLGLTAGGPVTFRWDSIHLGVGNTGPSAGPVGGMKVEAWANNVIVGNTGDQYDALVGTGATWETYTYDWTIPTNAQKLIFVPLWAPSANTATVGFDNVGVVPEPSTYALLALGAAGLGTHLVRRRRRQG